MMHINHVSVVNLETLRLLHTAWMKLIVSKAIEIMACVPNGCNGYSSIIGTLYDFS